MFYVAEFTQEHAKKVRRWRYRSPYHLYNYPSWDTAVLGGASLTKPEIRREEYRAAVEEKGGRLCGFFRFRREKGAVLLGLGLRPGLCSRGNGEAFLNLILEEFRRRFPDSALRLEVRTFNRRALRCY